MHLNLLADLASCGLLWSKKSSDVQLTIEIVVVVVGVTFTKNSIESGHWSNKSWSLHNFSAHLSSCLLLLLFHEKTWHWTWKRTWQTNRLMAIARYFWLPVISQRTVICWPHVVCFLNPILNLVQFQVASIGCLIARVSFVWPQSLVICVYVYVVDLFL